MTDLRFIGVDITTSGQSILSTPGTDTLIINAVTADADDSIIITGGGSVAAAGAVFLMGGISSAGTGGGVGLVGGDTSSSNQVGGSIAIRAGGNSASFDPRHSGDIIIGDANTDEITIGGSGYTVNTLSVQPGRILIQGHSFNTVASMTAGDIFLQGGGTTGDNSQAGVIGIQGGDSTGDNSLGGVLDMRGGNAGANGTGGPVQINAGIGGTVPASILIGNDIAQHPTGTDLSITVGSGNNIPILTLRDGYITISDTSATSDANISGLITPEANTLYAKSIVKSWGKATTGAAPVLTSTTDVYNVASITSFGTRDISVTFRRAMASTNYSLQVTNLSGTRAVFTVLIQSTTGFVVRAYDFFLGTTSVNLNTDVINFGFVAHGRV